MEKFRYAPGKPGFGSKGNDGLPGSQGLSMYFTNLDAQTAKITIQAAIVNNFILWTSAGADVPLRDGRQYVVGDVFIDTEGRAYRITNTETGEFELLQGGLNTAGYFTNANIQTNNGFNRYFNNNTSPKYLIDNVYSDGLSPYYTIPDNVYGIEPKDFARIEYSNVQLNSYNPFTLYSSGTDDANAIAIVRDVSGNQFHIGNLNNTGVLRNVGLTFDVASLQSSRSAGSYFTINSVPGTILTNYEINANSLFDDLFETNPLTFTAGFGATDVSITWNLRHFTQDTEVKADLHFYRDISVAGQTFNVASDPSYLRPYVVHDVSTTGTVHFSNLPETTSYKYHMDFYKNGWSRRSDIKSTQTGVIPYIVITPSFQYCSSAAHSGDNSIGFTVSSNVNWTAAISYPITSPFLNNLFYTGEIGDSSMFVDLEENTNLWLRRGEIRVSAITGGGNSPQIGTVYQYGNGVPITIETSTFTDSRTYCHYVGGSEDENNDITELQGSINIAGLEPSHICRLDISTYITVSNPISNGQLRYTYELLFYSDNNEFKQILSSNNLLPDGTPETTTYLDNIVITGIKDTSVLRYHLIVQSYDDYIGPHQNNYNIRAGFNINNAIITGGSPTYIIYQLEDHDAVIPCS